MTRLAVAAPRLLQLLFAVTSSLSGVRAVADSLLMIACDDMTPLHQGYEPLNAELPNPYRLLVDGPVVPGELVNVTLSSADGSTPFKGFMVQARDAGGHMLGTFLPDCRGDGGNKSHHMITCSSGVEPYNTVVQSNNKYKTHETFTWVAPVSLKGPFIFKYTVVLDFEHYWVNEQTPEIQVFPISTEEYEIKSTMNHEYYIYQLYIKNCFS